MTSRRIDQWLSLVGALLVFLSAYQLFFSRGGSYSGSPLGHVTSLEKVVKVKRPRALDWVDAFEKDLVTENQMIYTDELSRAEVRFLGGQSLVIGENSLVKLRSRGGENELAVDKGSVRARLDGGEPLVVKLNGKDYELRGERAQIEINLRGDSGEIGVLEGKVALEREGAVTELDTKTALVVSGSEYSTKKLTFIPRVPVNETILFVEPAPLHTVEFHWEGGEAELLISTDPEFSDPIRMRVNSKARASLKAQRYFWKLESKGGQSLTQSFRIREEISPEILRPRDGEVVDVFESSSGEKNILLEWSESDARNFLLETNGVTREVSGQSSSVKADDLSFNWRVKVNEPGRKFSRWSEIQNVRLRIHEFPKVPQNLYPDDVEYQVFSSKPDPVELSWASKFPVELEIRTPEGTLTPEMGEESRYLFDARKAGKYSWRVRGGDAFGRVSSWSEWKNFSLADLSGESHGPGVQRIQLSRPDQEVTFGWESGGKNVFELARDRSFQDIIMTKEVSGKETKLAVPKTGTYFWRSREYRSDGTLHVTEPRKVIIEPVPAPRKPEALPPMEVPFEVSSPATSWTDLFLSRAMANDFGVARITLPVRENVSAYVLRIYRKGEREPILEEKFSGKEYLWKSALPGEYDFSYAVVDFFGRQSPFSDRSRLVVKDSESPGRPLLIAPIRLERVDTLPVNLRWTKAERARNYRVSLSRDENLREKMLEKETKENEFGISSLEESGNYFWQVVAVDREGRETPSSVGRFVFEAPYVKPGADSEAPEPERKDRDRAWVAWAPSMDTYKFSDGGQDGKISGNVIAGLEARGSFFRGKWNYTGELLRQSGKVYKKEEYAFTKITASGDYLLRKGKHTFSVGPLLGFSMGQSYGIKSSAVTASGTSGPVYGGVLRSWSEVSENWSAEGKASYLMGPMTELEVSGMALRRFRENFLVMGLGITGRSYSEGDGEQSSIRLSLGFGREL